MTSSITGLEGQGAAMACATEAVAYLTSANARELLLAEHIHPNRLTPYFHSCRSLTKRKYRKEELIWKCSASQPAHLQTNGSPHL